MCPRAPCGRLSRSANRTAFVAAFAGAGFGALHVRDSRCARGQRCGAVLVALSWVISSRLATRTAWTSWSFCSSCRPDGDALFKVGDLLVEGVDVGGRA